MVQRPAISRDVILAAAVTAFGLLVTFVRIGDGTIYHGPRLPNAILSVLVTSTLVWRRTKPLLALTWIFAVYAVTFVFARHDLQLVAGFVAVIPLYALGLVSSYFGSRLVTVLFNGQSAGTYDHYFALFLSPVDVLWSFLKVMLFSIVVILIHTYYGYRASGGPAGVGVAVGRAVRTAIVMINIIDFFMSLAIWGATTTVRVAG